MSRPSGAPATAAVHAAIDMRRFPWIRPLVAAYASDFPSVAPLFAGDPASPEAWRATIERVSKAPRDRARVEQAVSRQLDQRGAPQEARTAARRLADPSAVAVLVGQQAGLFGGPLYVLLKAITAIQMARALERDHRVPAVPVFWVDAEDHDWAEISKAGILDEELSLRHITVRPVDGAGTRPAAALTFDAGIEDALRELEAALPASEFKAEVMTAVQRRYRPGAGVATAFAGFLDDLLGRHGLVVFESGDSTAKPLVATLFLHEIERPGVTARLAREAAATLTRLGHRTLGSLSRRQVVRLAACVCRGGAGSDAGEVRHDGLACAEGGFRLLKP